MPKQSSYNVANSFLAGKKFNGPNSSVTVDSDGTVKMFLFGNHIATKTANGEISVSNAGWPSNTTRDRLNALGLASFSISGGKRKVHLSGTMYMNGEPMKNDVWYKIK